MKRLLRLWGLVFPALALLLVACGAKQPPEPAVNTPGEGATTFALTSPAFAPGEAIPARHTCSGADVQPDLVWTAPPPGTQSLALIMDDPDAPGGTWVHWVLFNLPPQARTLTASEALPAGSVSGKNSWGNAGYGGPCPPFGTHHYYFKLYALDVTPDLAVGATKAELLAKMEGHVLAKAELMGTYAK